MTKKLLVSVATATLLSSTLGASTLEERFNTMEKELLELKAELSAMKAKELAQKAAPKENEKKISASELENKVDDLQDNVDELNKRTGNNHLKFDVDFRTAIENMQYKMADGSKANNDAFMTNRLWLGMNWAATDHISFTGQLAYNKAFGARSGTGLNTNTQYENFDWISNENAYDDTLRVRSAYFFYKNNTFLGLNTPWTFSLGRRPSTNGHLVNLRDDDQESSPMGHSINVEFDGLSSKFSLDKVTGVPGMYLKLCAGRGMTNAQPRFSATPYAKDANDTASINDIDLAGFIFVPYDNGQYKVQSQFYYANNLIDSKTSNPSSGFQNVGGLYSETINFVANGIGNGISEFLDNTTFFVSGAFSQTKPNANGMLGSNVSKMGHSEWVGLQFPSLISKEGRWGLEYNHGSKYWRSIAYGEDTDIGSKLAARGNAYEAYFTEPLVDNILSFQLRYTYIKYDYTGSNGFFGNSTGTPYTMSEALAGNMGAQAVKEAQDIRAYLRYKF